MLGKEVRDRVTGFTGIVTSKLEYLTGCIQYCVVPKVSADNKYPEGTYIDYQRLEVVGPGMTDQKTSDTGGDMVDAPKHSEYRGR